MSKVIVVAKRPRDNGMLEIDLSQEGTRFTVHVPAILEQSEDFDVIIQHMANTVVREADRLRSIVDANRGV